MHVSSDKTYSQRIGSFVISTIQLVILKQSMHREVKRLWLIYMTRAVKLTFILSEELKCQNSSLRKTGRLL